MNQVQNLQNLGLSRKEAELYIAALSLGECTLLEAANKAKVKRTTAYTVVESLVQKGLLGTYKTKRGLNIMAQNPDVVLTQVLERAENIRQSLPELKGLYDGNKLHIPKVSFFKGRQGYNTILEDTLREHLQTVRFIGALKEHDTIITKKYDYEYYIPMRLKRKIRVLALIFNEDLENIGNRDHVEELRELRILPEQFKFNAVKAIYGDKVAIFSSPQEEVCALIESRAMAEMERQCFDIAWHIAKPL